MPLTDFQRTVLRILAENRSEENFVAGSTPLLTAPNSIRFSNDVDFFHDRAERVESAFAMDRDVLAANDIDVEVTYSSLGFVRAIAKRDRDVTKLEWSHDSSWRFMPVQRHPDMGFVLHPIDLAINKVLALVGREEPRDVLDTIYCHTNILSLGALVWAASGKDPGLSPGTILTMIRRRGKIRHEDLQVVHTVPNVPLEELKRQWLEAIEQAADFIQKRPDEEIGALYYSRQRQCFVTPTDDDKDVVPHYGRPGGVLPRMAEGD